jgi:hypothetical protein
VGHYLKRELETIFVHRFRYAPSLRPWAEGATLTWLTL